MGRVHGKTRRRPPPSPASAVPRRGELYALDDTSITGVPVPDAGLFIHARGEARGMAIGARTHLYGLESEFAVDAARSSIAPGINASVEHRDLTALLRRLRQLRRFDGPTSSSLLDGATLRLEPLLSNAVAATSPELPLRHPPPLASPKMPSPHLIQWRSATAFPGISFISSDRDRRSSDRRPKMMQDVGVEAKEAAVRKVAKLFDVVLTYVAPPESAPRPRLRPRLHGPTGAVPSPSSS